METTTIERPATTGTEFDPKEYGFRWYPIMESDPEWKGEERIVAYTLKKAPRLRESPTGFQEDRTGQRYVSIVTERYKVLPNEVVSRVASIVARKYGARLVEGQKAPNYETEWYLHREYQTDKQVVGLGAEASVGFIVENAVNRTHALMVNPMVLVEGIPLVAGRNVLRNLKNMDGRYLGYRRHTKNMVEEGLDTLIKSALESADVFANHCQHLASTKVEEWPQIVNRLLVMQGDPLPNKVFPGMLLTSKGEAALDKDKPETWTANVKNMTLLNLYTSMAGSIRALNTSDERKTQLLEQLGVPFAERAMVSWLMQGAKA